MRNESLQDISRIISIKAGDERSFIHVLLFASVSHSLYLLKNHIFNTFLCNIAGFLFNLSSK